MIYIYSILRTTTGDVLELKVIKEIYVNTVLFTDGTTQMKSMLKEVDNWIPLEDCVPDFEVMALGYQDEILIGYICGNECESENEILEKVTHWRPKPLTIKEHKVLFNS
jgi:hypothetical protein